ncbi:NTF2-like N-terminal transpeptidase domain-containing protein [Epilithonimonas xixisoli]|uniref:MecA-like transpeptidase family protein n=1 Tax=Epilithonimonas xixisoli TaxID=1476462 RepID=A0A4R8IAA9_9FLAO|nr:NTF2-like N-terminal transpeptidase domain-containing protein [Epilithonimonas xixisoli]TDX84221.1 MecA-like transpeptidase family protein [Epilithonimonas xixisoli]
MKFIKYCLLISLLIFTISCKKSKVDGSNRMSFQESINDMASSLPTLQQVKFNEALYILKTFGVEAEGDIAEITALGKLLDGKKTPEILALADEVAKKNGIAWSSTAPPSLGEMNIFGDAVASEKDPNDIDAAGLNIVVRNIAGDSLTGSKGLIIIPQLMDNNGNKVAFDGAALETVMEISSGGNKISTSKNLMQDPAFRGFTIKYSSLPKEKIFEEKIDIKLTVKTSKKLLQMIKMGIPVNGKALYTPPAAVVVDSLQVPEPMVDPQTGETIAPPAPPKPTTADPKNTVTKFLNNLSSQNFKAAFDASENPNWGSYDKFSNPNSGFGSVKNISVKNISVPYNKDNSANVNVTYDVTDKNGKTTSLNVTYGLKSVNNNWKITTYKINN